MFDLAIAVPTLGLAIETKHDAGKIVEGALLSASVSSMLRKGFN